MERNTVWYIDKREIRKENMQCGGESFRVVSEMTFDFQAC